MMYDYDRTAGASWRAVSISSLEKGIRSFARQLEGMGLTAEVDVYKSGRGSSRDVGTSYVELDITGDFIDADGDKDQATTSVKFHAGGFGGDGAKDEFGDGDSLREMKSKAMAYILKDLAWQGWKKP